jgi:tripeptidyl-peptidase I
MLLLKTLSAVVAVASSVAALNVPNDSTSGRVAEKLNGPPAGWAVDDSTPINKDTSTMKLRVQLVPQNMDKFHELAMDVRYLCYLLDQSSY